MKGMYLAAVAIASAALTAPAALAGVPAQSSSLSGEHLAATFATGEPTVTAHCDAAGVSTIATTFSGVATGPYPGTFTAGVSVKIGPQNGSPGPSGFATGPLLEYREVFRIESPAGTVYGAKTLRPDPGNIGTCREFHGEQPPDNPFPFVNLNGFVYQVDAPSLLYGAVVVAGRRVGADAGKASASFSDSRVTCCPNESGTDTVTLLSTGSFAEDFTSTAAPAAKHGRGRDDRDDD